MQRTTWFHWRQAALSEVVLTELQLLPPLSPCSDGLRMKPASEQGVVQRGSTHTNLPQIPTLHRVASAHVHHAGSNPSENKNNEPLSAQDRYGHTRVAGRS